jgi:hypothetical protein
MEQWEYLSVFLQAQVKDKTTREMIKKRFSKKARRYSPESLIPELDKLGSEGWELVHMEPIAKVGGNEDVLMDTGSRWTNAYFCVFKRRKNTSFVPVAVVASQTPQTP